MSNYYFYHTAIMQVHDGPHSNRPACGLQEGGLDTVDANRALGFPDDCREYTSVHNILRDLGVKSVRLMVRFTR